MNYVVVVVVFNYKLIMATHEVQSFQKRNLSPFQGEFHCVLSCEPNALLAGVYILHQVTGRHLLANSLVLFPKMRTGGRGKNSIFICKHLFNTYCMSGTVQDGR